MEREVVVRGEVEGEGETRGEAESVGGEVGEGLPLGEAVEVGEAEGEPLGRREGVGALLSVARVGVGGGEADSVGVPDTVVEGGGAGVVEAERVSVAVNLGEGVSFTGVEVGEGVAPAREAVRHREGVGVGVVGEVLLAVGVGEGESAGEGVGDSVEVVQVVLEAAEDNVGDGVGSAVVLPPPP